MKRKSSILLLILAIAISFYIGQAIISKSPTEQLFNSMVEKINATHVVNFKSGFAINIYDQSKVLTQQWQMKRQGNYDAWSKYLRYENVLRFEGLDDAEKDTSLSFEEKGSILQPPTQESYYKNNMLYTKDLEDQQWSFTTSSSVDLLELLPFNAEVLNRYAKYYKADNRGKFVVFFFSVDPNYLTRTFSDILQSEGFNFPYRFKEGTIKLLAYPDTLVPRRVYAYYVIENTETKEIYEYNINTYFSESEDFIGFDEPAVPVFLKELSDNLQ